METHQRNVIGFIALAALSIGGLVYLTERPWDSVYLLPNLVSLSSWKMSLFGSLAGGLPSFLHSFAFILLTSICVPLSKTRLIYICTFWFTVNSLFELGQSEPIAQWIATTLSNRLDGYFILENLVPYFQNGVFDISDIFSNATGVVIAYLTVEYVAFKKRDSNEYST